MGILKLTRNVRSAESTVLGSCMNRKCISVSSPQQFLFQCVPLSPLCFLPMCDLNDLNVIHDQFYI